MGYGVHVSAGCAIMYEVSWQFQVKGWTVKSDGVITGGGFVNNRSVPSSFVVSPTGLSPLWLSNLCSLSDIVFFRTVDNSHIVRKIKKSVMPTIIAVFVFLYSIVAAVIYAS